MKKYLFIILGILLIGMIGAGTLKTIFYNEFEGEEILNDSIWFKFDKIQIQRYEINKQGEYILEIKIQDSNFTDVQNYVKEDNLNFWELVMAIQKLKQENDNLKIRVELLKSELCLKDLTYSWC